MHSSLFKYFVRYTTHKLIYLSIISKIKSKIKIEILFTEIKRCKIVSDILSDSNCIKAIRISNDVNFSARKKHQILEYIFISEKKT